MPLCGLDAAHCLLSSRRSPNLALALTNITLHLCICVSALLFAPLPLAGSSTAVPCQPVHIRPQQRAQGLPGGSTLLRAARHVRAVSPDYSARLSAARALVEAAARGLLCFDAGAAQTQRARWISNESSGGAWSGHCMACQHCRLSHKRMVLLSCCCCCCCCFCPVSCRGIRSSIVQLEASAESLRFVTNNSPGKILGE